MNLKAYIKGCNRGEFQWHCDETTDGIGMGGVAIESVQLKGRTASISRESEDEFEVGVILKHPLDNEYEIIEYRSSRKTAREFAERLIKQDIRKDIAVSDEQLRMMRHTLGLDYKKKPYRNYFFTNQNDINWNKLIGQGLAIKGVKPRSDYDNIYFHLTKSGVEFVLDKNISDKFYEEL